MHCWKPASRWKSAIKHSAGRLRLPERPDIFVPKIRDASGIAPLDIDEESAVHAGRLPGLHSDPFDRMLNGCRARLVVTPIGIRHSFGTSLKLVAIARASNLPMLSLRFAGVSLAARGGPAFFPPFFATRTVVLDEGLRVEAVATRRDIVAPRRSS